MTADFNWFLNKQGPRGQQGVRGEQGFSPVITVAEDTAKAYILRIQTQDDTFLTPNLRGTVDDLGGTYVRYNPETGQVYAGSPDIATTETFGVIRLASAQDVTDRAQDAAITPDLLTNQIEALDLPNNYVTTNTNQTINAVKNFTKNVEFTNTSTATFRNEIKAPSIIEPYHGSTVISYKQDSNGNNRYIQVGGSQGKVVVRPSLKVVSNNVEYDVISTKDLATTEKTGIVKPDGSTVFVDENGVISAKSTGIDDASTSTQSTWSSSKINTEISTVAQEVVGIQGDVASLDADVSTLKPIVESHTTSIGSINDSIEMAMTDITELKEGKQDKLTAGNNITIEGNVISAVGGDTSNLVTLDTEQTISGLKTFDTPIILSLNKAIKTPDNHNIINVIHTSSSNVTNVSNTSHITAIHSKLLRFQFPSDVQDFANQMVVVDPSTFQSYPVLNAANIADFVDGTTITFTNNKLSAIGGSGGAAIDDTNPSATTVYSSSKVEELLTGYLPLSTYNELLARVEALENEINGGNA